MYCIAVGVKNENVYCFLDVPILRYFTIYLNYNMIPIYFYTS